MYTAKYKHSDFAEKRDGFILRVKQSETSIDLNLQYFFVTESSSDGRLWTLLCRNPMSMRIVALCLIHHGSYFAATPQLQRSYFIMPTSLLSSHTHYIFVAPNHNSVIKVIITSYVMLIVFLQSTIMPVADTVVFDASANVKR